MDDKVYIIHPKVPAPASVQTRKGFKDVWEKKGWQVISAEEAAELAAKYDKPKAGEPSEAEKPAQAKAKEVAA